MGDYLTACPRLQWHIFPYSAVGRTIHHPQLRTGSVAPAPPPHPLQGFLERRAPKGSRDAWGRDWSGRRRPNDETPKPLSEPPSLAPPYGGKEKENQTAGAQPTRLPAPHPSPADLRPKGRGGRGAGSRWRQQSHTEYQAQGQDNHLRSSRQRRGGVLVGGTPSSSRFKPNHLLRPLNVPRTAPHVPALMSR